MQTGRVDQFRHDFAISEGELGTSRGSATSSPTALSGGAANVGQVSELLPNLEVRSGDAAYALLSGGRRVRAWGWVPAHLLTVQLAAQCD